MVLSGIESKHFNRTDNLRNELAFSKTAFWQAKDCIMEMFRQMLWQAVFKTTKTILLSPPAFICVYRTWGKNINFRWALCQVGIQARDSVTGTHGENIFEIANEHLWTWMEFINITLIHFSAIPKSVAHISLISHLLFQVPFRLPICWFSPLANNEISSSIIIRNNLNWYA